MAKDANITSASPLAAALAVLLLTATTVSVGAFILDTHPLSMQVQRQLQPHVSTTPVPTVSGFRGITNQACSFSRSSPSRAPFLEGLRCCRRSTATEMEFSSTSREKGPRARRGTRPTATGLPEPGPAWLVEERDACGVGFIANHEGKAEHKVVQHGLTALGCMEHRGACLADNM